MKQQVYNPYLPSWEYVPDGEPHVFGDRVYVYGSHDFFNGYVFCMGDYVCWSAPVDNLKEWKYEGVIYQKTDDPINRDGHMNLFAPDVTQGPDGRYYLYYVYDKVGFTSVAVCDTPAGKYEFYGYVHDSEGKRLGERAGDEPQFDPGVLTEGDKTYLYTGFCPREDKSRKGARVTVLDRDMLTALEEPQMIVPGCEYSQDTEYEEHAFYEAPSIRKYGDTYYFVYSSIWMHELCYAVSKCPTTGFTYGGVLVSNCDLHIDSYKPADRVMAYGGNNHGGMVRIQDTWYIFYHRQTNGTWFSRQGCAEPIRIDQEGKIKQVEMTSCGLNGGPLLGKGVYPAYIACNLYNSYPLTYVGEETSHNYGEHLFPKVTQDGRDGDQDPAYLAQIQDGATAGFKYFCFQKTEEIAIRTRGYADGVFEVRLTWDGEKVGTIAVDGTNNWAEHSARVTVPDGVHALYLTYRGSGTVSLLDFEIR